MYEGAQEIFEYLPIRKNAPENDYINHLRQAFTTLDGCETVARPFAVMPFHLLFMMAVQYKVLRIYKEKKRKYELALTTKNPDGEERDILAPGSPLTVAFFKETEIVDLLKVAGLSREDARSIKKLIIRYRNDKIAHAKGYIELNLETKIAEYFYWLNTVQEIYRAMNQKVANDWLNEIQIEDDMEQFLETHFLGSCFSQRDFGDVVGLLLEAEQLSFEQWEQIVYKGLDFSYNQTITALRTITMNNLDDGKRFNAVRILHKNSEIDEEFRVQIMNNEKDKTILELLKS